MTHPFHPLRGEEYVMVGYSHTWGEYRVFFVKPGDRRVYSMPASWTDVDEPDAFTVQAAGRSLFRVEDLLALSDLTREMRRDTVSKITPDM